MPELKLTVPYAERPVQAQIRRALDGHRFNVLVTHRQMGKTVCAVNYLIRRAIENPVPRARYFYIAPFLKQAKLIAWDYLKYYLSPLLAVPLPGGGQKTLVDITENELKVTLRTAQGPSIRLLGADNPDALRGTYADGVVLDEYGDMKADFFQAIVRPMLLSRHGWVLFAGTPKGRNQFFDLYRAAQQAVANGDKEWWVGTYRADQTGIIPPQELQRLERETPANLFRQEYLCDFTASADNVLVGVDTVLAAQRRSFAPDDLRGAAHVLGVDPARYGTDRSVIVHRCGSQVYTPVVLRKVDNMALAARVAQQIQAVHADAVFIDAGNGGGVIDRLRELGFKVVEVNFGGAAMQPGRYVNKRAEMWHALAGWLRSGALDDKTDWAQDLCALTYDFDPAGRLRLESKAGLKARMGLSPDLGDALALTFAAPVVAAGMGQRQNCYQTEYAL